MTNNEKCTRVWYDYWICSCDRCISLDIERDNMKEKVKKDSSDKSVIKYTIIEMYFEENNNREKDPYFTWLSFMLDNWRIVKQYSTDMIQPYSYVKQ